MINTKNTKVGFLFIFLVFINYSYSQVIKVVDSVQYIYSDDDSKNKTRDNAKKVLLKKVSDKYLGVIIHSESSLRTTENKDGLQQSFYENIKEKSTIAAKILNKVDEVWNNGVNNYKIVAEVEIDLGKIKRIIDKEREIMEKDRQLAQQNLKFQMEREERNRRLMQKENEFARKLIKKEEEYERNIKKKEMELELLKEIKVRELAGNSSQPYNYNQQSRYQDDRYGSRYNRDNRYSDDRRDRYDDRYSNDRRDRYDDRYSNDRRDRYDDRYSNDRRDRYDDRYSNDSRDRYDDGNRDIYGNDRNIGYKNNITENIGYANVETISGLESIGDSDEAKSSSRSRWSFDLGASVYLLNYKQKDDSYSKKGYYGWGHYNWWNRHKHKTKRNRNRKRKDVDDYSNKNRKKNVSKSFIGKDKALAVYFGPSVSLIKGKNFYFDLGLKLNYIINKRNNGKFMLSPNVKLGVRSEVINTGFTFQYNYLLGRNYRSIGYESSNLEPFHKSYGLSYYLDVYSLGFTVGAYSATQKDYRVERLKGRGEYIIELGLKLNL